MPRLPLVEPPAPAQSAGFSVRADPNIYNGVAAAGERLGSAIDGIGQHLQQFAARKQNAVNAAAEIDANSRMEATFQDFQTSLQDPTNPENGDPATFVPRWNAKRQSLLDDLSAQNYSPEVRERLAGYLNRFQMQSDVQVRSLVSKKQVEKAVATYSTAIDVAAKKYDAPGAIALIDDGERRGLFNAEHAAQMRISVPRQIDHYQASDLIVQDPIAASDALDEKDENGGYVHFTKLDPDSRRVLQFQAHTGAVHLRSQVAEGYAQQIGAGQIPNADAVSKDLAAGRLTRSQAAALLKPPAKEFDSDEFASVMSRIAAYDPKNDPHKTEYAQLMQESAYGTIKGAAANDLVEMLKAKANPRGSLANEGVTLAGKQIDEAFENGFLGKWKVTVPPSQEDQKKGIRTPTTVRKPEVWQRATQARAKLYSQLQQFVRENPEARPDEVSTFINKQMAPVMNANMARIFLPTPVAPSSPKPNSALKAE